MTFSLKEHPIYIKYQTIIHSHKGLLQSKVKLPGHRLVVKLDTNQVILCLRWFEVDAKLCISLRLDIIWNIFSVNRDNDLQISGSSMGSIDREVDGLVDNAAGEVGHAHLF